MPANLRVLPSVAEIKAFGNSDFDVLDADDDGVVTRDESRQRRGAPVGAASAATREVPRLARLPAGRGSSRSHKRPVPA